MARGSQLRVLNPRPSWMGKKDLQGKCGEKRYIKWKAKVGWWLSPFNMRLYCKCLVSLPFGTKERSHCGNFCTLYGMILFTMTDPPVGDWNTITQILNERFDWLDGPLDVIYSIFSLSVLSFASLLPFKPFFFSSSSFCHHLVILLLSLERLLSKVV